MAPLLPIWFIALWAAAALAIMLAGYRGLRLNRRRLLLLALLDMSVLTCLLLALLQPVYRKSSLQKGGCKIVLLGDFSGSMAVCDMPSGISRRRTLADITPSLPDIRTEYMAYAGSMKRVADFSGDGSLPGTSPAGTHLLKILEESGRSVPLAAVVLFSDGAVNEGPSLTEAAKEYKRQGIPVSCVGLGGALDVPDYSVRWLSPIMSVMRDENCILSAIVDGTAPAELELTFSGIEGVIEKRKVSFSSAPIRISFEVSPRTEGVHSYMIAVDGAPKETRKDNNAAFAAVEAAAPPVFKVLSLLAGLDWEQRFINQFAAGNNQFSTASIVMLSEKRFAANGFPDNAVVPENKFPDNSAFYDNFDIVILDTRAIPALGEKGILALRAFVENKGGGLIVRGPVSAMPSVMADMLPSTGTGLVQSKTALELKFRTDFIFGRDKTGLLNGGRGAFPAGGEDIYFPLEGLRKSARVIAELDMRHAGVPIAAGMPFGAGRVVQTGLESTWRWHISGNGLHGAWWSNLFLWLAEAAKPRIREMNGRLTRAGEEYLLDLAVLDDDFLPAPEASVTALIRGPDSAVTELVLEPSPDGEGRYSAITFPEKHGEYKVSYRIKLPERTLHKESFFMASSGGKEMENTSFDGTLLRDVARISGGRYFNADEYDMSNIPLSNKVPRVYSASYPASSRLFAVLFVVSALVLCAVRRRLGLK